MKILFLVAVAWGSKLRAGCNNVNENGKSECFQQWKKSGKKDTKDALQCCMSYRDRGISEFNVPIIVLPYGRQTQRVNRPESVKCYPESSKDINGFFNFLDLYQEIHFPAFPDKTKSLNWNCFNTDDKFNSSSQMLKPNDSKQREIEERISKKGNFCRSLLYKYHVIYSSNSFQRDLCDGEKIVPYQHTRPVKLSHFNLSEQTPINVEYKWGKHFFNSTIYMRNSSGKIDKAMRSKIYQRKRPNNTITVFEDFREAWKNMGVQFQESHHRRYAAVHREFHCGCFDYPKF